MNGTGTVTMIATPESSALAVVRRPSLPCQRSTQLFFAEREADVNAAKALCADCPIRDACLLGAIERREPWGVWGGEVFVEGTIVARKRGRGRPRKHPVGVRRPRRQPAAA